MKKSEWEYRIITLLTSLYKKEEFDLNEIELLLNEYSKIIHKREQKRNSNRRRKLINKLTNKEKITINKNDSDRIKDLLKEVLSIL